MCAALAVFVVLFVLFAPLDVLVFAVVADFVCALGGRSVFTLLAFAVAGLLLALLPLAEALFAEDGRFVLLAGFAATTPLPLNCPGFALAATVGCP